MTTTDLLGARRSCGQLNINAKKQQKKCKCLLPDMKGCIQESVTISHLKRQESLSPETKSCIQEINSAAHQKQR
jgi:hypothetical protein